MSGVTESLLAAFRRVVGEQGVVTDPAVTTSFTTDWTGRWQGTTPCVLRPQTDSHVAAVLALCHDADVAVVPQGGNTGLVGGSVPRNNEVVLSLAALDSLTEVNRDTMTVTVGAGVTLARLHQHAEAAGLAYGVDMASRDSATLGGNIATDAGGIRVVRYGTTRQQVQGVAVALPNGLSVTRLDDVAKDTVGYAIDQLFVGSEGTLGVLTRAKLALHPRHDRRVVGLVALDSMGDAVAFARLARSQLDMIDALEVMPRNGVELVAAHRKVGLPFERPYPVYVLIEVAAQTDPFEALAALLSQAPMVKDATVAVDRPDRQRLWELREGHTEAISHIATTLEKFDVSVPLATLDRVLSAVTDAVAEQFPQAKIFLFGHLAEGNLHLNVCDVPVGDLALEELVVGMIANARGSISAEHGVGVQKTAYLPLVRSADERVLYRAVKAACDPKGIMNPGVIV